MSSWYNIEQLKALKNFLEQREAILFNLKYRPRNPITGRFIKETKSIVERLIPLEDEINLLHYKINKQLIDKQWNKKDPIQ